MAEIKATTYIDINPSRADEGVYRFDAVFKTEHDTNLTITESPVQTGASISDHAYMEPKEVTFDVGMSDVMANVTGQGFDAKDGNTRSITAYLFLRQLQEQRTPCRLVTRLGNYTNMLVETITTSDDNTTALGLKATVTMKEILVVAVETVKISARPQASTTTNNGDQKAQQADSSILSGFFK